MVVTTPPAAAAAAASQNYHVVECGVKTLNESGESLLKQKAGLHH